MAVSTVEQKTVLPDYQRDFLEKLLTDVRATAEQPVDLPEIQVAGLTPIQQQAIERGVAGIGSFQPMLQAGSDILGMGVSAAMPDSTQAFMNPFIQNVIDQNLADIQRQGDIARQQIGSSAVQQGAFGGSRQAVLQGEIAADVMDQQARTGAQLRSAGFQQAQNLAQQAAQQQLRQAQLTGQLGQTTGALGAQIGQMGTQTAALGQLGQQMGVQDINTLLGIGGLQQGQQQKGLDITRENLLAQQALPFQRVGFLSDIFRGVPALQQTVSRTSTPPPSRMSQLGGLGIAGLGAIGQAGGFSKFFG